MSSKSESISDLIFNENNINFQNEKNLSNNISKKKSALKPVEIPNLLICNKTYETSSYLINDKKDKIIMKKNISNNNNNESSKKIILKKNNTHVLLEKIPAKFYQKTSLNNSETNTNNSVILSSCNGDLNNDINKNSISNNNYNKKSNNTDEINNNILLNNSDCNSSKSSWKFDKNLLDDSSFRKVNIKKEKLEIDCEKDLIIKGNLCVKEEFDENHLHDGIFNNKFIAYSSANKNIKEYNLNENPNCNKSVKTTLDNLNVNMIVKNITKENNAYNNFEIKVENENTFLNNYNNKDISTNNDSSFLQITGEQNHVGKLNNQIMSTNAKNIAANLDKNVFISKNNINFKNIEENKKILLKNNSNINKNAILSDNKNKIIKINTSPAINNNETMKIKKPENKINKSLSCFKFDFQEEDLLNSSNTLNFKIEENEQIFNRILSEQIQIEFFEVNNFLESIGLLKHLDNFLKNGLSDLDRLVEGLFNFM